MTTLLLPDRSIRRRQPQTGARLILGNPMTRGINYARVGGRNLVGASTDSGTVGRVVDASGISDSFNGSDSALYPSTSATTQGSLLVRVGRVVAPSSNPAVLASQIVNYGNGILLRTETTGSLLPLLYKGENSFDANLPATQSICDGNPHTIVCVFDYAAGGRFEAYVDGVPYLGTHPTAVTPASPMWFGAVNNSSYYVNWQGSQSEQVLWTRLLSPQEAISLSQNPWQLFAANDSWLPLVVGGGGNVSVGLTGQAFSFSTGALTPTIQAAITGQAATFATGTLVPGLSATLTGQSSTFTTGSLTPAISAALAGLATTFSTGNITAALALALNGQSALFATGVLGPTIAPTLTGQSALFSLGTLGTPGGVTISLTGQAFGFTTGNIAPGVKAALNGQTATFALGTVTPVSGITVGLTGQSFAFNTGTLKAAISAALSGNAATFVTGTLGGPPPAQQTMPLVVGLEYPAALVSLVNAGIRVLPLGYFQVDPVVIVWQYNTSVRPGFVISQVPAAGTLNVAANTAVTLTVSNYPMSVAYPAGGTNT